MRYALAVVMVGMMVGCAPTAEPVDRLWYVREAHSMDLTRYHDKVLAVTCYRTGNGLSCLPDSQTARKP